MKTLRRNILPNEKSREMVLDVCPKCDRESWILVIQLEKPEIVNAGTKWEFTRTEIRSKCADCYF